MRLLLFIVLVKSSIFAELSIAQGPSIQWQKCYGGSDWEFSKSVKQTADNGYLIGGETVSIDGDVSGDHGGDDFWVLKIDNVGNLEWQKCYGGSSLEVACNLEITYDNGFVIAGYTSSSDGDVNDFRGGSDYWIVKCDSDGIIQWKKCFGGSITENANEVITCKDHGFLLIGLANSVDSDVVGVHDSINCQYCPDVWLVKLDSNGTKEWAKCYGGTLFDQGFSVTETVDSQFVFAASVLSYDNDVLGIHGNNSPAEDIWVVKIDALGNIIWSNCIGGWVKETPSEIKQTYDGGFIIIGTSNSFDIPGSINFDDAYIAKLDNSGNLQWHKSYGGYDYDNGKSIIQLSDSSYMALCNTASIDHDVIGNHSHNYDVWLLNLDQSGNIRWQQCMGGTYHEEAFDISTTSDSGFIFTGPTESNDGDVSGNHGYFDDWVVKLSPLPDIINAPLRSITNFNCFVDQENKKIVVDFYSKINETGNLQFIDITGRALIQKTFSIISGYFKKEFDSSILSTGIYLLRLQIGERNIAKMVVIE